MASSHRTRTALLAIATSIGVTVVLSLLLYLAVAHHLILSHQTVRAVGSSMHPTLQDGQAATLDWSAYRRHPPARGEIVLFLFPSEESIKRIIAIPGDHFKIVEGKITVNGELLAEPYLAEPWTASNTPFNGHEVTVPAQHYFVLGDNRNHSSDSRAFGFIPLRAIAGRILPK